MTRIKDKNGLTPQQEMFCQYVVDAYGNTEKGILVAAYRKVYNCRNDAKVEAHYVSASRLANNPKIKLRIEELREEQAKLATISREEMVNDDLSIVNLDPLDLWIEDEKTHNWRMRYLHEIPKRTRKFLKFVQRGKRMVPDVDKDAAKKRLIDLLGLASAKDVNVKTTTNTRGVLRIGFDDED